jgi:hypothetical protein
MQKLTREDLMSLERYAAERTRLRGEVIAHRRLRNIQVGPNMTWCFEDRTTVFYQIQEMLRAEKIFEADGIQDELDSYNPLIPDGSNWKATLLLEYPDPEERRVALAGLIGVEDRCWTQVSDMDRVFAIADEDLERENAEKTSAVPAVRACALDGQGAEGRRLIEHRRRSPQLPSLADPAARTGARRPAPRSRLEPVLGSAGAVEIRRRNGAVFRLSLAPRSKSSP